MNHDALLDRIVQANPKPALAKAPDSVLTRSALLVELDRRSGDMQTQNKPIIEQPEPPRSPRSRWLVPALAGAAALVVAIVVAVALTGGENEPVPPVGNTTVPTSVPESAPLTLLEVGEALNQAAITGDWEAERLLYAEDATYTNQASVDFRNAPENLSMREPASLYDAFPIFNVFDWDGDGTATILDLLTSNTMANYAVGVTARNSCREVDATTLRCDILAEGDPFLTGSVLSGVTSTYTVVEGRITWEGIVLSTGENQSEAALRDYHDWVRASHAELDVDGALFETWGGPLITPDTVETHRELIAEWRAQR